MAPRSPADRSKSVARLAAVQAQLVRLAECRVAAAERDCRELSEDKQRLQAYLIEEGALGVPFATAALRSLQALDGRLADAEQRRVTHKAALAAATLRESAVSDLASRVGREARRAAENEALADLVDTWLATGRTHASLP